MNALVDGQDSIIVDWTNHSLELTYSIIPNPQVFQLTGLYNVDLLCSPLNAQVFNKVIRFPLTYIYIYPLQSLYIPRKCSYRT